MLEIEVFQSQVAFQVFQRDPRLGSDLGTDAFAFALGRRAAAVFRRREAV